MIKEEAVRNKPQRNSIIYVTMFARPQDRVQVTAKREMQ